MNTINRNNYEEFFLLYVDNELDEASRTAVEEFVQQNPDLNAELHMLLQTKTVAEEPIFFDKEILLRTEGNSINELNHEEYFLLYIDNELSAAKRAEVEMYVLQHPKLQEEFTTLKQLVLTPEAINYGDKKELYRTDKRRAIYLTPWRLAAAAILIGISVVGWWLMQKPVTKIEVAAVPSAQRQPEKKSVVTKPVDTVQQSIQQPEQIVAQQSSLPIKNKKKAVTSTTVAQNKKENKANTFLDNDNTESMQVAVQQHPVIKHNDIEKDQKEPPAEATNIAAAPDHIEQQQNDVASLQTSSEENNNNNYKVYPVAYKELNTNDDDNSLHVGMLDLNKTKVKNLFKKAGRIFGNKSNNLANEDGKLQVANFEIETKKQ